MARSDITTQSVPDAGLNITDMTMTTMTLGANNGVQVIHDRGTKLLLRNSTGGGAVYTVKIPTPTEYANHSITIPDKTVNVATGKDYILPLEEIEKQTDGKVYVDCDVAAKIAAIRP